MNQYATNNNPSRSAVHESACSVAYAWGRNHGLNGNKGLPRSVTIDGLFINRNSICSHGTDMRLGHKAGYAAYLAKGGK